MKKYGIFHYSLSNHYHERSALIWYKNYGAALKRAEAMMKNTDGLNLVIRTFDAI